MNFSLHSLLFNQAKIRPDSIAIEYKQEKISYQELSTLASAFAGGYSSMNLPKGSRVGIFLAKQVETISTMFGTLLAGGSIVPVNPILKPNQIEHILCDCDVSILVTSKARLKQIEAVIENCPH